MFVLSASFVLLLFALRSVEGSVYLPFPMIPQCNAEVEGGLALRVCLKYTVTLALFGLLQE